MKAIYPTILLAAIVQFLPGIWQSILAAEKTIQGTVVDTIKQPISTLQIAIFDEINHDRNPFDF